MAVFTSTAMALKLLAKALIKKFSKDAIKKAVKSRAKKAIKGKIKEKAKKFLKGKKKDKRQRVKNIMQEQGAFPGGGALAVSSTAIATTPLMGDRGGALAKVEGKGALVKSDKIDFQSLGQKIDNIAGMTEAVERLTGVQKKQKEDAKKARQVALDKEKKAQREKDLEKKKGIGDNKVGGFLKKKAEDPLAMIMRFIGSVVIGSFVMRFLKRFGQLQKVWKGIVDGFNNFFWIIRALLWKGFLPKTLVKGIKEIGKVVVKGFKLIGKTFGTIGKSISNAFGKAGKILTKWITGLATRAKDAVLGVVRNAGKWVKNAGRWASKLPGIKQALNVGKNVAGKVSGGLKAAKGFIGKGVQGVKGFVGKGVQGVKGFVGKGVQGVKGFLGKGVQGAKGFLGKGLKGAKGLLGMGGKGAGKVGGVLAKAGKMGGKLAKGAAGILSKAKGLFGRIPIIGPLMVALASMLAGDPPKQTLFKAVGAALGGLAGSFIPIPVLGTILGEITGEFIGDLFYTLVSGGGWEGVVEKTKAKLKQILEGGKAAAEWLGGGFKRFTKGLLEKHPIDIPKGGGRWSAMTWMAKTFGMFDFLNDIGYVTDGQVSKFPNLLQLWNPFSMGPLLIKSFFPPGESKEEKPAAVPAGADTPSVNKEAVSQDIDDISVSAGYEKTGESHVFMEAPSPLPTGGGGGKSGTVMLRGSSKELLNSYYKAVNVTAPLYKG